MTHFVVVLVHPQNAGNVGAVARAMLNMGLEHLTLVAPECDPFSSEGLRMARDAQGILRGALRVASLDEALADCHYAVGTTARRGKRRTADRTPRQVAPELVHRAASQRVALVFGPEDRGLSTEHLLRCQEVLTIPTASFHSLNLAQAVMIVAYELFLCSRKPDSPHLPELAPLGEQETMFQELQQALLDIGYLNPQNPEHIMLDLRRLLGRAGLTSREVTILRGLARQIRWTIRKGEG